MENGRQVVIVIDEWDAVFRERENDTEGQTEYLDFLRDLMKDNSHIALAYMTGILPIKKYGRHSALNMFTEYSMMYPRQLARYTGFTEEKYKSCVIGTGVTMRGSEPGMMDTRSVTLFRRLGT